MLSKYRIVQKDNGENIITFLTDVKLDGENYPERLIISSLEAKALLTDLYKEWDIHFYRIRIYAFIQMK